MIETLISRGRVRSPHFIFLRGNGRYSDSDLLQLFGLVDYHPTLSPRRHGRHAILADDGAWTMIADDWFYTLWNMLSTRPTLQELGQTCDVFAGSVGDCDNSFDFVYYSAGQLVRRYIVQATEPYGDDVCVVENTGTPLPGEAAAFVEEAQMNIVLGVAASLGIETNYTAQDVRVYVPRAELVVAPT